MTIEPDLKPDTQDWTSSVGRMMLAIGEAATAPLRFFSGLNNNPHNREKFGWDEDGYPKEGVGSTQLGAHTAVPASELQDRVEGSVATVKTPFPTTVDYYKRNPGMRAIDKNRSATM